MCEVVGVEGHGGEGICLACVSDVTNPASQQRMECGLRD
jgi:hypothetical protein